MSASWRTLTNNPHLICDSGEGGPRPGKQKILLDLEFVCRLQLQKGWNQKWEVVNIGRHTHIKFYLIMVYILMAPTPRLCHPY